MSNIVRVLCILIVRRLSAHGVPLACGRMAAPTCCRCHLLMAGHHETVNVVGSHHYHASWQDRLLSG